MLKRPDDWQMAFARAEAEAACRAAKEKAARRTGITWGAALGTLVGLAAFAAGLI